MEVREVNLLGHRFTWSNGQATPTLTRIDHAFCMVQWEELHREPILRPLSSSTSDHCPLMLQSHEQVPTLPTFKFEAHSVHMSGFFECVKQAWDKPIIAPQNAMMKLHIKLAWTAKALALWARTLIPQGRLAAVICREVIARLEQAQEGRLLSEEEVQLMKLLKNHILGIAAIERSRVRQRSRLTWIKKGDANTWYFHIMAVVRKQRNFIAALGNGTLVVSSQQDKHGLIHDHFQQHLGTIAPRKHLINFQNPGWQLQQLHHLELPFTEQEVASTIQSMPKEKVLGPDGFIGPFRKCWDIVKPEIMDAVQQFYNMNQQGLHFLNQALVVLIPKKQFADKITDFRPISPIHSSAKIISELLANRLSLELNKLVALKQYAFIKRGVCMTTSCLSVK
jgi:hypothetical protein